jgi:hypothetical protein
MEDVDWKTAHDYVGWLIKTGVVDRKAAIGLQCDLRGCPLECSFESQKIREALALAPEKFIAWKTLQRLKG